jgi:threonyl-tRNA synthetase
LAPTQVIVLPISEKTEKYATETHKQLIELGIRAELNNKPEKIGAKIREAELLKINVMLIIGAKENENNTVTVRKRFEKEQEEMTLSELSEILTFEINQRRRNLSQT